MGWEGEAEELTLQAPARLMSVNAAVRCVRALLEGSTVDVPGLQGTLFTHTLTIHSASLFPSLAE